MLWSVERAKLTGWMKKAEMKRSKETTQLHKTKLRGWEVGMHRWRGWHRLRGWWHWPRVLPRQKSQMRFKKRKKINWWEWAIRGRGDLYYAVCQGFRRWARGVTHTIHTYVTHTYIPTYSTYMPTYIDIYVPTYIPTYIHSNIHIYIHILSIDSVRICL